MNPDYFGSHSLRKGAVTHTACGITSSPPIASICIRANRKMPGVMNRYIKYEAAGDQYVGRCVSGRNRLGKRFAESLPYFDFSESGTLEKEVMIRTLDNWISKTRMPEAGACNDAVFCLFEGCVASLLYHKDWLKVNLHSLNSILLTPFLSEMFHLRITSLLAYLGPRLMIHLSSRVLHLMCCILLRLRS